MNHTLTNRQGFKVAVIVNYMSEINIDAQFIKAGTANLPNEEENRYDDLLIESTGISEPMPVRKLFHFEMMKITL